MGFLWKFCGVNIVKSVSSFVSVENYGSFEGLINVVEISNAIAIAHARQGVYGKVCPTLSYYFEEDLNAVADSPRITKKTTVQYFNLIQYSNTVPQFQCQAYQNVK